MIIGRNGMSRIVEAALVPSARGDGLEEIEEGCRKGTPPAARG